MSRHPSDDDVFFDESGADRFEWEYFDSDDLTDIDIPELVRVKHGPCALQGLIGSVIRSDGEFIVVSLYVRDDSCGSLCDFRMPRAMVEPAVQG